MDSISLESVSDKISQVCDSWAKMAQCICPEPPEESAIIKDSQQ
jgi:hypothetical protein